MKSSKETSLPINKTPPPLAKSPAASPGGAAVSAKIAPRAVYADTSRRITALRFLLAVLVVFIHNNPANTSASAQWVQAFISEGIARCAVPLFFLFAAYLQAKKADPYPALLKKKAKSLALPYVLWLALAYFFPFNVVKLLVAKLVPQIFEKPDIIPSLSGQPRTGRGSF